MTQTSTNLAHANTSCMANVITNTTVTLPPSPKVTLHPGDDIISISNNGELVVRLKQDGTVIWENVSEPDVAAKAFGEALRSSIQYIAGIDGVARHIIETDLITFLMKVADQEGALSAEGLKIAFEHICVMKRLRGGK